MAKNIEQASKNGSKQTNMHALVHIGSDPPPPLSSLVWYITWHPLLGYGQLSRDTPFWGMVSCHVTHPSGVWSAVTWHTLLGVWSAVTWLLGYGQLSRDTPFWVYGQLSRDTPFWGMVSCHVTHPFWGMVSCHVTSGVIFTLWVYGQLSRDTPLWVYGQLSRDTPFCQWLLSRR